MKIIIELSKRAMTAVLEQNDCIDLINDLCSAIQEAETKLQAAKDSFERLELHSQVQSMANSIKNITFERII